MLITSVKKAVIVSRLPSKDLKKRWDSKFENQAFPSPTPQCKVGVLRFYPELNQEDFQYGC